MKKQPKSVRRIINAFLEMRASRPLEKIMVTELCEKADINKSTFYAYYRDIYDLSEKLENEIIERILTSLPSPELIVSDPSLFARHLMNAFQANSSLISIIFSDSRTSALPERIDHALREYTRDLLSVKVYIVDPFNFRLKARQPLDRTADCDRRVGGDRYGVLTLWYSARQY